MQKFEEALSKVSNYANLNTRELRLLRNHINQISEYIDYLQSMYPDKTTDEIVNLINEDYEFCSNSIFSNTGIRSSSIQYEACCYLINHPQKITELLNTIEQNNIKDDRTPAEIEAGCESYSSDFEDSLLRFVLYRKEDFKQVVAEIPPDVIPLLKQNKDLLKKNMNALPFPQRKAIADYLKYIDSSYPNQIKRFMIESKPFYEQNFKDDLITSIDSITTALDTYGFLEKYENLYNEQVEELNLPGLKIPTTDGKENPNLGTIFAPEHLRNLSLEELISLNHFYINRISKEYDHLKDALFVIDDLNLYQEILAGKTNIGSTLSEDDLYYEYLKLSLLELPTRDFYRRTQAKLDASTDLSHTIYDKEEYKDVLENGVVEESFYPVISEAKRSWNKKYRDYFSEKLPGKDHNLGEDLGFYLHLYNPYFAAYQFKGHSSSAIMAHLHHSPTANWGYIPEFSRDGKNSIENHEKFILIGVDCEGLNRPIYTHELSDNFKNFFKTYTGSTLIPIYEGCSDFRVPSSIARKHPSTYSSSNTLKNNIALPLSKKQKKYIKLARKDNSVITPENHYLIKHLDFLRDSKYFPEHLKISTLDPKKNKSILVKPSRFIDLETGKCYEKVNDELTEIKLNNSTQSVRTSGGDDYRYEF